MGYRYFEVLNCPGMITGLDLPNEVRNVPKLARLLELMHEDYASSQVIVYVWHIEMQVVIKQLLEQEGRKVAIMNGDTRDRDSLRDGFNNGTFDILVTNIRRSLNLMAGDACIFYSVETNPGNMEQIAGRIDRYMDEKAKEFVLLAYEGEEANFFMDTVRQRSIDSEEFTDVVSETVVRFGRVLLESYDLD
jgi:SNF2 family DNA or RNA helicase